MKRRTSQLVSAILVVLFLGLFSACSKKYPYSIPDGVPGMGADSASISVDTSMSYIDASAYAKARIFPGLVGTDEPRIKDTVVTLDLDYEMVDKTLRISVPPQPQFSTGLYAAPGELIKVTVPDGLYSLSMQIGAWTDDLSGKLNPKRAPKISSRMSLVPGDNYMRNLFGGPIYIWASRPVATPVKLAFSGAVKSPDFVLGETTNEEWNKMIEKTEVPWFEMRSKRIAFELPISLLDKYPMKDPENVMKVWDTVMTKDYFEWFGLSDHPANPIDQSPKLPMRAVLDIDPVVGYGHSGFPVVFVADSYWFTSVTDPHDIRNSGAWGALHEFGHDFQMGSTWSWGDLGEVSNNLHSFKVMHRYGKIHNKAKEQDFITALEFAASDEPDKSFSDLNFTERLVPFVQVFELYGYDFQTYLCKAARRKNRLAHNDQDKKDFYYEKLSEFVGMDMASFMEHWGIFISQQAKDVIAQRGLPPLNRKIWEYNPWTGQGGNKGIFTVSRSDWEVVAPPATANNSFYTLQSGEHSDYEVTNLFDGDANTFWCTPLFSVTTYTYYFIIDMTEDQPVSGFYFVHRTPLGIWDSAPEYVSISVGNNPASLNEVVTNAELPLVDEQIKIDLPDGIPPFQYFKIEFTNGWKTGVPGAIYGGDACDMAEVGIY